MSKSQSNFSRSPLPNFIVPNQKDWCSDCGKLTVRCSCSEVELDAREMVNSSEDIQLQYLE